MKNHLALLVALVVGGPAIAADLSQVDRTIRKEPTYQTPSPRYGLLVFGPEAKDRVWLVHDGDTLYVDRNGNGDLTEPGEAVAAKRYDGRDPAEFGHQFEAGELNVGGRVHKGLSMWTTPITRFTDVVKDLPNAQAALATDPKARAYSISLDVDRLGLLGQGVGGRVITSAGVIDGNGALLFADKSANAPVIHFDGPLQVTLYGEKPTLKLSRDNNLYLVVGTPGLGPGTFAMLAYEETIPVAAIPKVEVQFAAARENDPPVRELYELKERC